MRILVVEDEPTLQAQLREAIAAAGHTVETAADGESARYLGEVEEFDAVVLDLGLPVVDGLTVLRHWRALPEPLQEQVSDLAETLANLYLRAGKD